MRSPLDITELSRQHQIEAIMARFGRSTADPRKFRNWLESLSDRVLADEYRRICGEAEEEVTYWAEMPGGPR